jgi:hypothetical protein
MTGPEHYKQAEALLIQAVPRDPRGPDPEPDTRLWLALRPEEREQMIAGAHVHTTLALAAAVGLRPGGREQDNPMTMAGRTRRTWEQAAGESSPDA